MRDGGSHSEAFRARLAGTMRRCTMAPSGARLALAHQAASRPSRARPRISAKQADRPRQTNQESPAQRPSAEHGSRGRRPRPGWREETAHRAAAAEHPGAAGVPLACLKQKNVFCNDFSSARPPSLIFWPWASPTLPALLAHVVQVHAAPSAVMLPMHTCSVGTFAATARPRAPLFALARRQSLQGAILAQTRRLH